MTKLKSHDEFQEELGRLMGDLAGFNGQPDTYPVLVLSGIIMYSAIRGSPPKAVGAHVQAVLNVWRFFGRGERFE